MPEAACGSALGSWLLAACGSPAQGFELMDYLHPDYFYWVDCFPGISVSIRITVLIFELESGTMISVGGFLAVLSSTTLGGSLGDWLSQALGNKLIASRLTVGLSMDIKHSDELSN